jgi:fatty acid desaturase
MSAHLPNAALKELGRLSPLKGIGSIVWTWAWIAGMLALYCVWPSVWTFLLGLVVISGRHLALAVLMHEGAHRLIVRNKRVNDALSNWLTAYPIMLRTDLYRMVHLQHHKATWTDADPDIGLARPFPITKKSMLRKVVRDLTGRTGYERYRLLVRLSAGLVPGGRGLGGVPLHEALRNFVRNQYGFLITNGVLCAALALAGRPEAFLLLWWLPALTGYSLVLRLRSIAEHAVVSDPADELRQTRTTLAPFWLRFLIAPHNVGFHLEHHLFMFVPHYKLRKAHRMLREAGVLERAEVASSYLEVLRRATSATEDRPKPRGRLAPGLG